MRTRDVGVFLIGKIRQIDRLQEKSSQILGFSKSLWGKTIMPVTTCHILLLALYLDGPN